MEISNMISHDGHHDGRDTSLPANIDTGPAHQYPTRHAVHSSGADGRLATPPAVGSYQPVLRSPASPSLKNVSFELSLDGSSNVRGRLPMRVQIFPHDTTESIVTTVKNFYGLYDSGSQTVSFEDVTGRPLDASYDNLTNNMTVYVRVLAGLSQRPDLNEQWGYRPASPARVNGLVEGAPMLPPQPSQILNYGQPPSRPGSRVSRKPSVSPKMSHGKIPPQKARSRSGVKVPGSSFQAGLDELNSDAHNGYSSSDGGAGSVTSSRKARSEQLASAEISVDNILDNDRRQKAKFESSELPLFVPPQVLAPNSISSVSPQRRPAPIENPSPFARPLPHALALQPLGQAPPVLGASDQAMSAPPTASPFTIPAVPTHGHRLRDRTSGASLSTRSSLGSNRFYGSNILPTPDPTIASCISDEDVALQLMRLGDASNFSNGRFSTSTLDDGLSGRADAASSGTDDSESDGEESDGTANPYMKSEYGAELVGPPPKKQRRHTDDGSMPYSFEPSGGEGDTDRSGSVAQIQARAMKAKKPRGSGSLVMKPPKHLKHLSKKPHKHGPPTMASTNGQPPISPSSLPPPSRKTSAGSTLNFQHPLGDDEEDLSSKPRCQRCRKSKKGCDRQRPCQRCKDAGIGIEGCLSEDEGNGRKGRYGRHMGVSVKRVDDPDVADNEEAAAGAILTGMGLESFGGANKKRKRSTGE